MTPAKQPCIQSVVQLFAAVFVPYIFSTVCFLGSLIEMRVHAVHAYQKSYTIKHPVNRISRNSNSYIHCVSPNWFAFADFACQTHLELVVYGDLFTLYHALGIQSPSENDNGN